MTLAFHGGARTEVQYCVMCHNPSSIDPSTDNSLDFKVMFHKIHMGVNLPSVMAGGSYYVFGFMNSISDFSKIVFPTFDLRTCYKCHDESNPATPQTVDWRSNPGTKACGSCHDNVNFQTGANHSAANLGNLSDSECATCHGPNSTISTGSGPPTPPSHLPPNTLLRVDSVHVIPAREFQKKFLYNILKTTNTGPGQTPVIQFSVTDPTNNSKPWNLLTDESFTNCAAASPSDSILMIAWNTLDYTNTGIGANGGEIDIPVACAAPPPTANGDGTFSITSPMAIPPDVTGTAGIYFNGHPSHDLQDGYGVQPIPVPNVIAYSSITDPTPVPRRDVVDVNKCNVCHDQLNPLAHGGDRVATVKGCPFCHAPNATDQATRAALGVVTAADAQAKAPDQLQEQSIDFKVMIHAAHIGPDRGLVQNAPFVVYHDGAVHDFTTFTPFPGAVNNCLGCHLTDTYYPPDPNSPTPLASVIHTVDATGAPLPNHVAVTAGAAVCSSCHATVIANTHMMQNGANFAAVVGANNQVVSSETCLVCHGPGALADVKVVHKLASYQ
jgi:OmcA/MtrC family decaheme c-type cytochrome